MIIEPVPARPRTARRRIAQLAGVAVPVVLLAVVIVGGLLGHAVAPTPNGAGAGATRAWTAMHGAGGIAGAITPVSSPAGSRPGARVVEIDGTTDFPTVAAGLTVHTVVEALAMRGVWGPEREVAVAGYLGVLNPPTSCPGGLLGPLGPACERIGVLAQVPWAFSGGAVFAGLGPHLHPRFPVGLSLPAGISRTTTVSRGAPVPTVVIGRFEAAPDACGPGTDPCDARFLADGIAWTDGVSTTARPVLDVGLDGMPADWVLRNERAVEVAAIGWSGTILAISLVRPATVPSMDPAAGAALAAAPTPAGLVWYVRGLETGYDAVGYPYGHALPRLTWVVLDDVTGAVLARNPSPDAQPAS